MASALLDAFHAFAGSTEMDGRKFVKCMRDSMLIDDDFRTVDADLVFAKCKARGARKIDYCTFLWALREVAKKRGMTQEQVEDIICLAHAPDYESNVSSYDPDVSGPQRFYYDVSSYTGTHKRGGPSLVGGAGKASPVDFQRLVNRDREKELAASAERRRKAQLSSVDDAFEPSLLSRAPGDDLAAARPPSKNIVSPLRGPERFYYDKSSYTGTHKNGGPTVTGNGLVKEGYGDLSELVCRDVIQDDDLNRRSRWRRNLASAEGSISSDRCFDDLLLEQPVPEALPVLLGARRPAPAMAAKFSSKVAEKVQTPSAPHPSPRFIAVDVPTRTLQWYIAHS